MADTQLVLGEKKVSGYLSAGAGPAGRPSVLVIHEYWGLNDQIRRVCDRLAKEGFVAFAPDLYHGKLAVTGDEAMKLLRSMNPAVMIDDLRTATHALAARDAATKVGIMGFCMGGGVALIAASHIPELAAAVPYYGLGSPGEVDAAKIKARIQGHYAKHDEWCTAERVAAFEKQLKDAGVPHELHRYDAKHAFANDERPEVYSEKDAKVAWDRTVRFLHETLG
jgi:carboxymethylenebutenolidase